MKYFLFIIFCWAVSLSYGQKDSTEKKKLDFVYVYGQVIDTIRGDQTFQLMVVNKNLGTGHTGSWDGSFAIQCRKTDTLLIAAGGYNIKSVSFKDSTDKKSYQIKLYIQPLNIELASVEIRPMKTIQDLQEERKSIEKEDVRLVKDPVSMVSSPITALYQYFSKRERSKRLVAEMEYEDKKREFLKELFKIYIDYDIISLETHEFDQFIDFLRISDEMLKFATEVELIDYIQGRYKQFKRENDYYFVD